MINLSKLEEIKNLRKVWNNEARNFAPWLAGKTISKLFSNIYWNTLFR